MLLVCVESGEIPPLCKVKTAKLGLFVGPFCFQLIQSYTAVYKAVLQDGGTNFDIWMCMVLMT